MHRAKAALDGVSRKTDRLVVERADESVTVTILGSRHRRFRLDDGVDTTNFYTSIRSVREQLIFMNVSENLPRCATSVATSNNRWSLTSRWSFSPDSLMMGDWK